jgi:uncharacterized integral membrane protein (TIGR00698 family)
MAHDTPFYKTEDFWAMAIGIFLLLAALGIYFSIVPEGMKDRIGRLETDLKNGEKLPFKSIAWHEAKADLEKQKLSSVPAGVFFKKLTAHPNSWTSNPTDAFFKPASTLDIAPETEAVNRGIRKAMEAENAAVEVNYADENLNRAASEAISKWQDALKKHSNKSQGMKPGTFSLLHTAGLFVWLALLFGLGARIQGTPFTNFLKGFAAVFSLALVSLFLASQKNMKDLGIEYAVWAIVLGILVSNTVGTPKWVSSALTTEFYIKTGLILMGAEVLINKIMAIGLPGMFVAWVVTPIVLVTTYWFGQNILKIASKSLNITISADMSVCGVSAAVATAAASKATREELTVAIGLSMVFTAIMMIVMPLFIKFVGMPEVLGGAWIGGTIDSSGAVVAAGAALGDKAMYVAATIKMIQNMLIGLVAFGVAVYFAAKVDKTSNGPRIGAGEIWRRFPKFILGFIGASLLFSLVYKMIGEGMAYAVLEEGVLGGFTKNLRTWFFCLAFASIGLSTNFRELKHYFRGGKPLMLYVCGQALNLLLTLGMAYLMFYKVFPEVTKGI